MLATAPENNPPTSNPNASRLRENQRRSRARKKEYLTSLESRFKACQRTGIEANIEIQNAAKRVVRENLRLRELLRRKGVHESEVVVFLKEGEASGEAESAIEGVIKVLGKRPCGGEDDCAKPSAADERQHLGDRRNSTGMVAARDAGKNSNCTAPARDTLGDTGGGGRQTTCNSYISKQTAAPQYPTPSPTSYCNIAPALKPPPFSVSPAPCGLPPYIPPLPELTTGYSVPILSPTQPSPVTGGCGSACATNGCRPSPDNYVVVNNIPPTHSDFSYPGYVPFASPAATSYTEYSPSPTNPGGGGGGGGGGCPVAGTTPCSLAQSYIQQFHPTLDMRNEMCSPGADDDCCVDNGVLFGVLDRI